MDKDNEDFSGSVGCLGCLALVITWPYYFLKMLLNGGTWG